MRILLVTPYFYPHKGGSQQYAEEIYAKLMKSDPEVKVDVLTYNTDKMPEVEEYRGFTIYRVPCFQPLKGQFAIPNYIKLQKTIQTLFKKNRYDFVNSHTRFFENSWWVPAVAKHYNTKSVLTDHCAAHPVHNNKLVMLVSSLIDILLVPLVVKQYDRVTVTNGATKSFLEDLAHVQTDVIYGGVDTKFFASKNTPNKRNVPGIDRKFSKNDIVVSFVGRMIPSKGPHILLQAAQNIIKNHKNVYFIFGGNGELFKKLSAKKTSRIFFPGTLEKDMVKTLLKNTDILVHPSLHHEGFPNVLLEAGASGCAVIATDMGGTNEIITPETGILAKPTVKSITYHLEALIESRRKRRYYSDNLKAWVKKEYDWTKIVETYKTFIKKRILNQSLFPTVRMSSVPRN